MGFFARYNDITPYTLFCVASYLSGAILFGLDTGSFGSIQALPSWLNQFGELNATTGRYALVPTRASLMNSLPWIGKISGCFTAERIIDRLGFKKTAIVAGLIQIVGVVLELSAKEWIQFSIGRIVTYYAVGLCENLVPSYNAEIAPARHRGLLAGSLITFTSAGNLWGAGMGRAFSTETQPKGWLIAVAMQFIPALLLIGLVPLTPESPRWLIQHGRHEQAAVNLNKLRRKEEVESGATAREIELLQQLVEESREIGQARWSDMIHGDIPRRVWIVCTLFVISQTNGNQFVQSYAPTFYVSQGLGANSFTYNLLGQVVGLIGCFIGLTLLDVTGRRPLFIIGSGAVTFLLMLAAGLGASPQRTEAAVNTMIACFILLAAATRLSAANCAFLTGAEIGGVRFRKKIMSLGTSADVLAAFMVTFVTPYLLPLLGVNIAWIFGSVAAFAVVWGYFFFPELKGRSLEEVDELFAANFWAFKFKGYVTTGKGSQLTQMEHRTAQEHRDKEVAEGEIKYKEEIHIA